MPGLHWYLAKAAASVVFPAAFGFEVEGAARCPRAGGLFVFANHLSFLDPPLVGAALPRPLRYLAKEELFRFPLGPLIRLYGALPIRRGRADREALEVVLDRIDAGEAVLVFPEGTRSKDGRLGRVRSGAARLALTRPETPILPVGIDGSDRALPRGAVRPRLEKIRLRIGRPFAPAEVLSGAPQDLSEGRRRRFLCDTIRDRIAELLPPERSGDTP